MTLEQGTLLNGRYRIVDILGQGGMGSVYRALDENLGVEVAVKENLFTTDEYSRQFRLEAVILASLRHQNMPRVTDHFVFENQGQYLVMDYIEGEDLRQRMERLGTIPEEDAILIGAAICDALTHLHSRKPPVLHRDIKPGNVKITPDGRVFLVDFGLAKLVQGSQATTTGARAMTPGYSPPEQYGTARTDPRSDIYSMGATLYAALTGIIPEDGLARVMDNVQLTPIRKRNPKISRRLAAAIEKAMEAYPDDRFQTADEFRRALLNSSSKTQHFTDLDLNISVPPPPEGPQSAESLRSASEVSPSTPVQIMVNAMTTSTMRLRRRMRRYTTVITWAALIALTLVGWFMWNNNAPFRAAIVGMLPPEVAQTYVPNPTATPTATLIVTPSPTIDESTSTPTSPPPVTPIVTATPTPLGGGRGQIAFASDRSGGIPQVWLMDANGTVIRQITNEPDGACQPDWSPDGLRLVYTSPCREKQEKGYEGSSLYIINADGSGKIALATSLGGNFDPAWSPDGKRIAFTSLRDGYNEIYMINLDTNQTTRLTKSTASILGASGARMPAWNPLGGLIAFVLRRMNANQIWTTTDSSANIERSPVQLIVSGNLLSDTLPVWTPDGQFVVFNQTKFAADGSAAPAWLMKIRYEDRASQKAKRMEEIKPLPVVDVSYSPDGQWMAFESWPDIPVNQDIYIATITGANRVRLTTDPGFDFDPVWRPLIPETAP